MSEEKSSSPLLPDPQAPQFHPNSIPGQIINSQVLQNAMPKGNSPLTNQNNTSPYKKNHRNNNHRRHSQKNNSGQNAAQKSDPNNPNNPNQFFLFHPKPYWHWALEDLLENGISSTHDVCISVDAEDEAFIAHQIINMHLQKNPNDTVLYVLPSHECFDDRVTTLQISCSEGLNLEVVKYAEEIINGENGRWKAKNDAKNDDMEGGQFENHGGCLITTTEILENENNREIMLKNVDFILIEKCSETLKNKFIQQRINSNSTKIVYLYNSVIDLNLHQQECADLLKMSENFHADASHTHLHQYFNVTVNNVVERGLNSGKVEPANLAKEWEKYLPFQEEIKICKIEPTEQLCKDLKKIVDTELADLKELFDNLVSPENDSETDSGTEYEMKIWPTQETVQFQPNSDEEPEMCESLDSAMIQERKKQKYASTRAMYYPQLEETREPLSVNFKYPMQKAYDMIDNIKRVTNELGIWAVYRYLELLVSRSFNDLLKEDHDGEHPPVLLTSLMETSMKQIWLQLHEKIMPLMRDKKFSILEKLTSDRLTRLIEILNEYKHREKKVTLPHQNIGKNWLDDVKEDKNEEDIYAEGSGSNNSSDNEAKIQRAELETDVRDETSKLAKKIITGVVLVEDITIAHILTTVINDFATWVVSDCKDILAGCVEVDDDGNINKKGEDTIHDFRQGTLNFLAATCQGILKNAKKYKSQKRKSEIPRCNLVVLWNDLEEKDYGNYVKARALFTCTASGDKRRPGDWRRNCTDISKKQRLVHLTSDKTKTADTIQKMLSYEALIITQLVRQRIKFETIDSEIIEPPTDPDARSPELHKNMHQVFKRINWYVGSLPTDSQTQLLVNDRIRFFSKINKYQCEITLPTNSAVKGPFVGKYCSTRNHARLAAAYVCFKAIQSLKTSKSNYADGIELKNLKAIQERLPAPQKLYPEKYPAEFVKLNLMLEGQKKTRKGRKATGRPGSNKRKQVYKRKIPKLFQKPIRFDENGDALAYLYCFDQSMNKPIAERFNEYRRPIFFPENVSLSIGLISPQPLPHLPEFPIFTRSGEEKVQLKFVRQIVLHKSHLNMLVQFHRFVIKEVLRLERRPLEYIGMNLAETNSVFVALNRFPDRLRVFEEPDEILHVDPMVYEKDERFDRDDINGSTQRLFPIYPSEVGSLENNYVDLDWAFICKTYFASKMIPDWDLNSSKESTLKQKSRENKKIPFQFDEKRLIDSVLLPTYRAKTNSIDQIDRYYVARIDAGAANSKFPGKDDKFKTYHDYFEQKYDEITSDKSQRLLEVDHTPNRLNLIVPRRGKKQTDPNNKRQHDGTQRFIAELCRVHPIPNFYWRKLVNIPSMMYRITALLNANDIRVEISKQSQVGIALSLPIEQLLKPIKLERFSEQKVLTAMEAVRDPLEDIPEADDDNDVIPDIDEFNEDYTEDSTLEEENDEKGEAGKMVEKLGETYSYDSINILVDTTCVSDLSLPKVQLPIHLPSFISKIKNMISKPVLDENFNFTDKYNLNLEKFTENDPQLIGPSASLILQALTLTSSSDGFNLDRVEMLGDSFLKFSYSIYLYCTYPHANEGHLSALRSYQVANLNLYEIGRYNGIAECIVAAQMEVTQTANTWMPPLYSCKKEDEESGWNMSHFSNDENSEDEDSDKEFGGEFKGPEDIEYDPTDVKQIDEEFANKFAGDLKFDEKTGQVKGSCMFDFRDEKAKPPTIDDFRISVWHPVDNEGRSINDAVEMNILKDQSIADKSIADSVEALVAVYLLECGSTAAQRLLCTLGIPVLRKPKEQNPLKPTWRMLHAPKLKNEIITDAMIDQIYKRHKLESLEKRLNYKFKNRYLLISALTHASYQHFSYDNKPLPFDCYQRLEFLGDAVLDFLITHEIFKSPGNHNPGALTDIRSALVNNHRFGEMCVENEFHQFFFHKVPEIFKRIDEFVRKLKTDDEGTCYWEDMASGEAPKQVGDIFESLAGAVYLDSCNPIVGDAYALTIVWNVFARFIRPRMQRFCKNPPVSPIRELLEMYPQTKFSDSPEKLSDTTVRVTTTVTVNDESFRYQGTGQNYKTAKELAAKEALKDLKARGLIQIGRKLNLLAIPELV